MDLWEYTLLSNGTYGLNSKEVYSSPTIGGSGNKNIDLPGYKGNIINGKIEGKVPQYISTDNGKNFNAVTSMYITFHSYKELIETPKIPFTVTSMYGTFAECTGLEKATNFPGMLETMTSCFYHCKNLKEVVNLPNSIKNMNWSFSLCEQLEKMSLPSNVENIVGTFSNCSQLINVPYLPESIKDMTQAFINCSNLSGIMTINCNPQSYAECFKEAATNTDKFLILNGNSNKIKVISYQSSNTSKIKIDNK